MDAETRQQQFQLKFLDVLYTSRSAEEAMHRLLSEPDLAKVFQGYEVRSEMLSLAIQTFQYHARETCDLPKSKEGTR